MPGQVEQGVRRVLETGGFGLIPSMLHIQAYLLIIAFFPLSCFDPVNFGVRFLITIVAQRPIFVIFVGIQAIVLASSRRIAAPLA